LCSCPSGEVLPSSIVARLPDGSTSMAPSSSHVTSGLNQDVDKLADGWFSRYCQLGVVRSEVRTVYSDVRIHQAHVTSCQTRKERDRSAQPIRSPTATARLTRSHQAVEGPRNDKA